jgi:NAD(P)-dependent dehydrogenase (short-subunit alcohol dehydrogenase family)
MVAYLGAHVVVTGGTGALGTAVVGALRGAGAVCHVTNMVAAELDKYPHRDDAGVHITRGLDLADEAAVRRFYGSLPPLWGSIHLAGGFAMSPVAETSAVDFADQFQMNALSSFPQETSGEEIWINAVAPSVLDTPANRKAMPDADHATWVAPAAVAELITFLASPDNRVTRGAVIPVYGGA